MEKFMKKNEEKGITLIALIITIIVLIILAGISIATLSGQNGILTRTAQAKVEECHGVVKEEINMMYTQYITDLKTIGSGITSDVNITRTTSYEDYLKLKGIIDDSGKVDIVKLTGGKKYLGNGTNDKDIYTLVSNDEENAYELKYSGEDGTQRELLTIAKDSSDGSIDYTKMEAGLYKTGTNQMIMSWEDIVKNNYMGKDCMNRLVISQEIPAGDLLIAKIMYGGIYGDISDTICGFACPHTNLTRIILPNVSSNNRDGEILLGEELNKHYVEIPVNGDRFDQCTSLEEIDFLGNKVKINNTYLNETLESLKTCIKLKAINMSQECYDFYDWQNVVDAINESRTEDNLVKINIIY